MIFFCEHGQLGNQIFQYAALRTHGPHHKLVLFGCDRLYATFDGIEAEKYCQGYRLGYRIIKRTLPIVERVIRATRLMTLLFEFTDDSTVKLCVRPGLFGRIQFCQQAFFQSPQLFDSGLLEGLVVKPALLQAAEETLADSVALYVQSLALARAQRDFTIDVVS